jgi:hypothetical protein
MIRIPDPDPDFYPSWIPDPGQGSKRHRIPDPDPQHCFKQLYLKAGSVSILYFITEIWFLTHIIYSKETTT